MHSGQAGPTRLRVLCYNVHALRGEPAALAAVVREIDPDVMIIQEAPRRFRWRSRCAALAHSFRLVYAAGGLPALGNLVLTSLRIQVGETWCTRYPHQPGRHLRGAVFARCRLGVSEFVVAGSHLSTDPAERLTQARLLKAGLAAVNRPVILGADLNETAEGAAWQLVAAGLVDVATATGAAGASTYPARAPVRRIDALLCDPALPVQDYRVAASPAALLASDHLPIVAELSLP